MQGKVGPEVLVTLPAMTAPSGRAKPGFWGFLRYETYKGGQSCFAQLWALSLQKSQKNTSTFSSADSTASCHVGLLLVMVPGTAASQPENFIVLDEMVTPFLHRADVVFITKLRLGVQVVGLLFVCYNK